MSLFPSVFVSHGSPAILLEPTPSHHALRGLGASLSETAGHLPSVIVSVTAHWETAEATVSTAANPPMIYDFWGFPKPLYDAVYPAPGQPEVARRAISLLQQAGLAVRADGQRGYDHGTWIPLALMFPQATIPVVQVSVQSGRNGAHHWAVGRALRALREEGALIIGSGSLTHNLRAVHWGNVDALAPDWVESFGNWVEDAVVAGEWEKIRDHWHEAPFAARNHPSPEHFLPLLVAAGAGSDQGQGTVLHRGNELGVLRMDAYAFS